MNFHSKSRRYGKINEEPVVVPYRQAAKIARMIRHKPLQSDEFHPWSPGILARSARKIAHGIESHKEAQNAQERNVFASFVAILIRQITRTENSGANSSRRTLRPMLPAGVVIRILIFAISIRLIA